MTREEAIKIIERVDICANAAETARDMAIAALREPEMVRCKDCKHRYTTFRGLSFCTYHLTMSAKDNAFCSDGERKDNETV